MRRYIEYTFSYIGEHQAVGPRPPVGVKLQGKTDQHGLIDLYTDMQNVVMLRKWYSISKACTRIGFQQGCLKRLSLIKVVRLSVCVALITLRRDLILTSAETVVRS